MRTSIRIDDAVGELAAKIAKREKRNFSNLCEVALSEYCSARQNPGDHAELIAAAEQVGVPDALAVLRRERRRKAKVAA